MTIYLVYREKRIEAKNATEAFENLVAMNGLKTNFQYFTDEKEARAAYDAITLDPPRRFSSPAPGLWSFYDGKIIETRENCDEIDGEYVETLEEAYDTGLTASYDAEIGKDPTYMIRDREAGNFIAEETSLEAARDTLRSFEENDRKEDTYTPDFYEIVDPDGNIVD